MKMHAVLPAHIESIDVHQAMNDWLKIFRFDRPALAIKRLNDLYLTADDFLATDGATCT